jgi:hypothetical protein
MVKRQRIPSALPLASLLSYMTWQDKNLISDLAIALNTQWQPSGVGTDRDRPNVPRFVVGPCDVSKAPMS